MDFGEALREIKKGNMALRNGWNGKGMFVFLQPGYIDTDTHMNHTPYLMIRSVDGSFTPWICSQTDVLAEDWGLV